MILKVILKKIKSAWHKFITLMGNPAWQGVGVLVALAIVIIPSIISNINNKHAQVPETIMPSITPSLVITLPTKETPFIIEKPVTETLVIPTMTLVSPTQEEPTEETPTIYIPTESVSSSCLSDQWKPYPLSLSPLVKKDKDGCLYFKEIRFGLKDKTLHLYANPANDTNLVGIYMLIPEGEWHKVFEIQVNQLILYDDGRRNSFYIGFIDPSASKFNGKYLEIYSTKPDHAIGRLFTRKQLQQRIFEGSKIVFDCEITDLQKTTCSIKIDDGSEQIFENVLQDDQPTEAFFIGYNVFKDSTLEISITDISEEPIFQ